MYHLDYKDFKNTNRTKNTQHFGQISKPLLKCICKPKILYIARK